MGLGTLIIIALGVILYLIGLFQAYQANKNKKQNFSFWSIVSISITLAIVAVLISILLILLFTYLNQFRI